MTATNPGASPAPERKPVTILDFVSARQRGAKLSVVTAYDFPFAQLVDQAGADAILVGDSLGMVVQGHSHVLSVTLDEMIYHVRMVARAARRAMVIADLPFMTYQLSSEQALQSAGRLVQEGGAHAVKLEGGQRSAAAIAAITSAGIPVMGHVGLTPQSIHHFGGFRVQRDEAQLTEDARAIEAAGAFSVVVECVPAPMAERLTAALNIPTIGIGAGPACDGQVLVLYDLLGLYAGHMPKFAKQYATLAPTITQAVAAYCQEVQQGKFPAPEHTFR